VTALKLRRQQQDTDREQAGRWVDTGLVFTTRFGTPIEPRNFTRSFDRRISKAKVRRITVHGTRKIPITMEIHTEVVSSATREALRKLGDQLGS
jgi:integrase